MGISVKLPITVRTDNIGAIFMAENTRSGVRARHINSRYHFIKEYVENGFINILFVKTEDKDSNLFTKNIRKDTYKRHVMKFLGKVDG
jgi:hypothetical protein